MKDVRKEINPLSEEFNCIHAFLVEMSKEDNLTDKEKIWMTKVREMSYDIEDSLDDFMIHINNDDKSAKANGLSLIKKCKRLLGMMKAHQQISKAVHDFKTRIKEVGDRNQGYRTGVKSTCRDPNEVVDSRALVIFQEASELVGIHEPKNELISLLTEDGSSSQHQVKVASIVGFGGLGKTTLANQAFQSLNNKFNCHTFVTVSRNPDMMKVLRTILSDNSGQEYTNTEAGDVQHLVKKISNFLQDKSWFVGRQITNI
ncbi:disease resistance protein RGA5-like isoform X1 [Miscanthus floridulus]|uniref:disease resistance protein RGA5-like isoform X1 n=1 Tax=Miscanthus floridulus TaxID=154761 RepID=UPI003458DAF9